MKTWKLQSALWVPHKPHQVFPFFADAQKLELLTPPWLCFQILTPMPVEMRVGALIDYRISLRGVPMKWRTRIARWEPDVAFADEQLIGPYVVWHHTHTFEEVEGGTCIRDNIRYAMPFGLLGRAVHWLKVRRDLDHIFNYRSTVIEEQFGLVHAPQSLKPAVEINA